MNPEHRPKAKRYPLPERDARYECATLDKDDVLLSIAAALNLDRSKWGALSKDEQNDLTEFYVNANAYVLSKQITLDDMRRDPSKIEENKTDENILDRPHDWTHFLDTAYRPGAGIHEPRFLYMKDEGYFEPETLREELYPGLFLPVMTGVNYVHALREPRIRQVIANGFQEGHDHWKKIHPYFGDVSQYMEVRLRCPAPTSVDGRIREYETMLKWSIIRNGLDASKLEGWPPVHMINETFDSLTDETRPTHYLEFAQRVFGDEYLTNPRLFVDEALWAVRKIHSLLPDTKKSQR